MPKLDYLPRVVDTELTAELNTMGAVLIEGPKACGKTSTAMQHAASDVRLDQDPSARAAAAVEPRLLLDGATPRLLDEWHMVDQLWNAVRREVDDRGAPGQFILTGSATPADDTRRHSGAGRFGHILMRPLSLFEAGSRGGVRLADLLVGDLSPVSCDMRVEDYIDAIVRGGWPQLHGQTAETGARFARNYLRDAIEVDVGALTGTNRDPIRMRRFLSAYAQVTAHPATLATIARRAAGDSASLTRDTADAYRNAAERLMLIEDLEAWSPALRSRTRLMATPKRHLIDPSLAASLLGAGTQRLKTDGETLGFLFESLATRDVRVYAQANNATVSHYRERNGDLECDLIVETIDGTWTGMEVKLGGGSVDAAAANLLRLAETRIERPPAALVVVTAGPYAYRRDDDVMVVPLGALEP